MAYSLSDFDDWSWNDAPITGETNNNGFIESAFDSIFGVVKDVADVKRYWEGDYGQDPYSTMNGMAQNQNAMLGTVEDSQRSTSGSAWYSNPLYLAAGVAAAGLLYLAVSK